MPDLWVDVDAAVIVPVNILPLLDDSDFKTIETAIVFNQAGLALTWNFVTTAGVVTGTAVTPTSGGVYDWSEPIADKGMYAIEIPASGGASINNDTEGVGWFTGVATGVLPWRGPTIGFRASGVNDKLIDSAYDTARGLAGTGLPGAAADAAGGLPISDAGGLDLDARIDAAISSRMATYTQPTGFLAATFPTDPADQSLVIAATDAIVADIAALNDLSAAQVNAEVVDALATDTYAEPGQATPAATLSLAGKLGYLFKAWRNRSTQTASQYSLYNDDATTIGQKATFSDDATTADRGEVTTGL